VQEVVLVGERHEALDDQVGRGDGEYEVREQEGVVAPVQDRGPRLLEGLRPRNEKDVSDVAGEATDLVGGVLCKDPLARPVELLCLVTRHDRQRHLRQALVDADRHVGLHRQRHSHFVRGLVDDHHGVGDELLDLHVRAVRLDARCFRDVGGHPGLARADGMRPATICGHLAYLKAALRWAAHQKLIHAVPRIEMPKVPKRRNICKITPKEFAHLLDKAPDDFWRTYIATAWYSRMRRNEMLELTRDSTGASQLDFQSRRIILLAAYKKSDDDQWVPLHPELAEVLQALPREAGHIFPFRGDPRQVSKKFAWIADAAGLKITLHDLRRSFGSRYASVVPAPALQRAHAACRHQDDDGVLHQRR
jgi:integrase